MLWYSLALAAVTECFVLFYEEPTLREKFGAEYQDYCRRVSRWVPHVPRSKSAAGD